MDKIKSFIIIGIIVFCIDLIFLNSLFSKFTKQIKIIQNKEVIVKKIPAFISYLLLTIALYYFIIRKKDNYKTNNELIKDAVILGSLIYGIFDATNLTLFNKWTVDLFIIDTIWGGILFGLSTYLYILFVKSN